MLFGMELGALLNLLGPIFAGLAGAGASQRWIHKDDRALVLRFGKVVHYRNTRKNRRLNRVGQPRVLEPGFNMVIPVIDKIEKIRIRQVVRNLGDEEITLSDMTVFTVDGVLVYYVKQNPHDIERAIFEVDDLRGAVRLYCIGVLREVVRELSYKDLITGSAQEINDKLTERVREQFAEWGLEVKSFSLGDLSPYGDTLRMIQTEASLKLKLAALEAAAPQLRTLNMHPSVIAALIGIPVATTISAVTAEATNAS
jgi:regulator of protease activity HflC (stomatin/prohibitin superfamily)